MFKCAFLGHVPFVLDVNVGAGSRPNMTARTVVVKIPETRVASVASNTISNCETFLLSARSSLVRE
jgi:hypothetical protein